MRDGPRQFQWSRLTSQQQEHTGAFRTQEPRPRKATIQFENEPRAPEWDWIWNSDQPIRYLNEPDRNNISTGPCSSSLVRPMILPRQQRPKKLRRCSGRQW